MKTLLFVLNSLILSACSVVGIRQSEQPDYYSLLTDGAFEIRLYSESLIAETTIEGDYKTAGDQSFRRLAGFIFGNNTRRESVAMTSPVYQEAASESIAMTIPVFQEADSQVWRMSFIMPKNYQVETLPVPIDSTIRIKKLEKRKVAVMSYSGSLNQESISEHAKQLIDWLNSRSIKMISKPKSAAYDPPWTIPTLRHNEIHIEIE
jgi:hypothetical protein